MKNEFIPHDHGNLHMAERLKTQLAGSGDFDRVAAVFRLLDDASRVRIFWLLCHCEECVLNISTLTGMSSPAVSHHLRLLKEAGLIVSHREGKEVFYRTAEVPAAKLLHNVIEKTMEISCPESAEEGELHATGIPVEQINTVRSMHDALLQHPEERVTIEELARRYFMNPTTLKTVFKAVYGNSLASHMKEHRMEKAAELLRRGDQSISEISAAVGYDSPSRFSAAFRDHYHMLPSEYRKQLAE